MVKSKFKLKDIVRFKYSNTGREFIINAINPILVDVKDCNGGFKVDEEELKLIYRKSKDGKRGKV